MRECSQNNLFVYCSVQGLRNFRQSKILARRSTCNVEALLLLVISTRILITNQTLGRMYPNLNAVACSGMSRPARACPGLPSCLPRRASSCSGENNTCGIGFWCARPVTSGNGTSRIKQKIQAWRRRSGQWRLTISSRVILSTFVVLCRGYTKHLLRPFNEPLTQVIFLLSNSRDFTYRGNYALLPLCSLCCFSMLLRPETVSCLRVFPP